MAQVGMSTSCFYPANTEVGLQNALEAGILDLEIHFSSFSELDKHYLKELRRMLMYYGGHIRAVHPFYSILESLMFFSDYGERRFVDGLEIYRQYFQTCQLLGAKYLVFHGGGKMGKSCSMVSDDEYIERYNLLFESARQAGVVLLHENVYQHVAEDITFCRKMIDYLGDKALFTFDNKQARRAGFDSLAFVEALSGHIRHLHVSDCDESHDCLLPGRGREDFLAMKSAMSGEDESACWMVEVYHDAFRSVGELQQSVNYLRSVLSRQSS